ncbi:Serine/threonine protein kinase Endoplasmic reticulum membrane [Gracilaria domingensis]|nr:Serine/threonine protein kinase Endoplasmic reticulum membrane [Gracilaria domingensis]
MGLFSRKASSRNIGHPDKSNQGTISPRKNSSKHKAKLNDLFSDAKSNNESPGTPVTDGNCFDGDISAPTVALDEFVQDSKVSSGLETSAPVSPNVDGDRICTLSDRRDRNRASTAPSNQDRAGQISDLARRNSIKRSVSRKIARSESRRQLLNIKDSSLSEDRVTTSAMDRSCTKKVSVNEKKFSVPMSRSSSFSARLRALNSKDRPSSDVNVDDTLNAMGVMALTDDVDEELEISHNSFRDLSKLEEARHNEGQDYGTSHESVGNSEASRPSFENQNMKGSKARRRPPPLLPKEEVKSVTDSTTDWPSGSFFGSDGGFVTGGFRITAEGMLNKPLSVTRQDSDDNEEGGVPQSHRVIVIAKGLKEFRTGPTIGTGAAGRVYIAEHIPSKTPMAMKVVNVYDKHRRNQLLKELETLSTHISRYLVRFYGAFYDGSGAVHIALEYMDHGCLATFIQRVGPIPERVVQMIAHDCVRGLRFLHRHHVLHRDFKTANILLSRRLCRAKLSDFGLARDLNPGVSKVDTFVGTVAYMSPERLNGSKYTYASDIWALGVSIMECLMGKYPFDRPQNYFDYIEATMTVNVLSGFKRECAKFSPEVRDFVEKCTYTDPKQRATVSELMEHPWLKGTTRDTELFGSWLDECRIISMRPARSHTPGRK